jgi:hypothetical protein
MDTPLSKTRQSTAPEHLQQWAEMWSRSHPQDVEGEDGEMLNRLLHEVEPDLWDSVPGQETQFRLFTVSWSAYCQRSSVAGGKAKTTNSTAAWTAAAVAARELRAFVVRNEGWFRPLARIIRRSSLTTTNGSAF